MNLSSSEYLNASESLVYNKFVVLYAAAEYSPPSNANNYEAIVAVPPELLRAPYGVI